MRTRWNGTILSAVLLVGSVAAPLAAQSTEAAAIRVRVIDAATGKPIGGAQVGFPELKLFRLASGAGIAQILDIPPGVRTLEVTMLGYGTATKMLSLEAHAVATGDIALSADPIEIEGLTVTASSQIAHLRDVGFYNRDRMGHGHQLGPLELAAIIATKPSDYFAKIPTVQLEQADNFGRKHVTSRRSCVTLSSFGVATPPAEARPGSFGTAPPPPKKKEMKDFVQGEGPNAMAVYLDGAPYLDELDRLPVDLIEAAEVYVGSEVPMQFSSHSERAVCGIILLWSKR